MLKKPGLRSFACEGLANQRLRGFLSPPTVASHSCLPQTTQETSPPSRKRVRHDSGRTNSRPNGTQTSTTIRHTFDNLLLDLRLLHLRSHCAFRCRSLVALVSTFLFLAAPAMSRLPKLRLPTPQHSMQPASQSRPSKERTNKVQRLKARFTPSFQATKRIICNKGIATFHCCSCSRFFRRSRSAPRSASSRSSSAFFTLVDWSRPAVTAAAFSACKREGVNRFLGLDEMRVF